MPIISIASNATRTCGWSFAPEQGIAFYGGDPDNFEYPRFDLDICIFRAYENGQPAHPEQHLQWSANGAAEHELIFVSGHPGSTSRQLTFDALKTVRDTLVPRNLRVLYRLETLLTNYSSRSVENARRAREYLFGIQNSRKANGRSSGRAARPGIDRQVTPRKKLPCAAALIRLTCRKRIRLTKRSRTRKRSWSNCCRFTPF